MEKKRSEKRARRKRAALRWPSRNDTWTEVYAGNVHATFMHARSLVRYFVLYIRKGKGSVPSLTCRRLEGERTIAGAERTRQLRSMMFFLGFWNSLTPLSIFSTFPFRLSLRYSAPFLLPRFFLSSIHFPYVSFALQFPWIISIGDSFLVLNSCISSAN